MKIVALTAITLLASITVATSLSAQAASQSGYPRHSNIRSSVKFNWNPETSSVSVSFYTGCLSTSARNLRDNFSVALSKDMNNFEINGTFTATWYFSIGTADCMGARTKTIVIKNVAAGFYNITRNGRKLWSVKLADAPVELKMGSNRFKKTTRSIFKHKGLPQNVLRHN